MDRKTSFGKVLIQCQRLKDPLTQSCQSSFPLLTFC